MKKISISSPILPDGVTHVNTTWNIYNILNDIVETESGNANTLLSYELSLPLTSENYYLVEAVIELSDGNTVKTTKVKVTKDTTLITDTVALPPKINFSIKKDGVYELKIDSPTLVAGVDEWVSTDWLVVSSAGVVLYRLDDSLANKNSISIPDKVISGYDFVVFKARYNLRQNSESKYGSFHYVRNHNETEFVLDQEIFSENQTNVYVFHHTKPRHYLFYYEVYLNTYRVLKGILSPETPIIIPKEFSNMIDSAVIKITDKNINGEYIKEFNLSIIKHRLDTDTRLYSSKQELTSEVVDTKELISEVSAQIAVSPIYKNIQSLQVQGGNRVYDNTFRCTYFDLGTQTLSVMKVGSTIEKLSTRLNVVDDIVGDFATYHIDANRVALYYKTPSNIGKLKMYDMSDSRSVLLNEIDMNPETNITSLNGKMWWVENGNVVTWDGETLTAVAVRGFVIGDSVIPYGDDGEYYLFSLNGEIKRITSYVKVVNTIPNVEELKVVNIRDTIVITFRVSDVITFAEFKDSSIYPFEYIEDLTLDKHILLLDHYNKHIHIVKG